MAASSPTLAVTPAATTTNISAVAASLKPIGDAIEEDTLTSSFRSCANDPDFAVICAFLQKFSKELGLGFPNFKHLQEWLTNTDEVSPHLRDLHIKLMRKTRKTVHEKSWESALSKFCFTYSAQDGWEVERFGYKKSSLKVKLRIFRELLESQFERNAKFRSIFLTLSADSLRSQPIGRDRLGHSYWLTQDANCNLRIYQEHLDEEIWQVVATNRDELVNLITRLRGNEVVLPSSDIGVVDEDTSSSNSCTEPLVKPPPPEEKDDSQEEEAKVPNLRIKLNTQDGTSGVVSTAEGNVPTGDAKSKGKQLAKATEQVESEEGEEEDDGEEGLEGEEDDEQESEEDESEEEDDAKPAALKADNLKPDNLKPQQKQEDNKKVKPLLISQAKIAASSSVTSQTKKRTLDDVEKSSPIYEELNVLKKARPTLLDSKRTKKPSRYEKAKSEEEEFEEDDEESDDGADEGEEEEEDDVDGEEGEENELGAEDDDEGDLEEGEEEDIDSAAAEEDENEEKDIEDDDFDDDEEQVGEAIEEAPLIVRGAGAGRDCKGGNTQQTQNKAKKTDFWFLSYSDEAADAPIVGDTIEEQCYYVYGAGNGADCLVGNTKDEGDTSAPPTTTTEPKATFFFGEPGCLKLSPMKQTPKVELKNVVDEVNKNSQEKQHNEKEFEEKKRIEAENVVKPECTNSIKQSDNKEKPEEIEAEKSNEVEEIKNDIQEKVPAPTAVTVEDEESSLKINGSNKIKDDNEDKMEAEKDKANGNDKVVEKVLTQCEKNDNKAAEPIAEEELEKTGVERVKAEELQIVSENKMEEERKISENSKKENREINQDPVVQDEKDLRIKPKDVEMENKSVILSNSDCNEGAEVTEAKQIKEEKGEEIEKTTTVGESSAMKINDKIVIEDVNKKDKMEDQKEREKEEEIVEEQARKVGDIEVEQVLRNKVDKKESSEKDGIEKKTKDDQIDLIIEEDMSIDETKAEHMTEEEIMEDQIIKKDITAPQIAEEAKDEQLPEAKRNENNSNETNDKQLKEINEANIEKIVEDIKDANPEAGTSEEHEKELKHVIEVTAENQVVEEKEKETEEEIEAEDQKEVDQVMAEREAEREKENKADQEIANGKETVKRKEEETVREREKEAERREKEVVERENELLEEQEREAKEPEDAKAKTAKKTETKQKGGKEVKEETEEKVEHTENVEKEKQTEEAEKEREEVIEKQEKANEGKEHVKTDEKKGKSETKRKKMVEEIESEPQDMMEKQNDQCLTVEQSRAEFKVIREPLKKQQNLQVNEHLDKEKPKPEMLLKKETMEKVIRHSKNKDVVKDLPQEREAAINETESVTAIHEKNIRDDKTTVESMKIELKQIEVHEPSQGKAMQAINFKQNVAAASKRDYHETVGKESFSIPKTNTKSSIKNSTDDVQVSLAEAVENLNTESVANTAEIAKSAEAAVVSDSLNINNDLTNRLKADGHKSTENAMNLSTSQVQNNVACKTSKPHDQPEVVINENLDIKHPTLAISKPKAVRKITRSETICVAASTSVIIPKEPSKALAIAEKTLLEIPKTPPEDLLATDGTAVVSARTSNAAVGKVNTTKTVTSIIATTSKAITPSNIHKTSGISLTDNNITFCLDTLIRSAVNNPSKPMCSPSSFFTQNPTGNFPSMPSRDTTSNANPTSATNVNTKTVTNTVTSTIATNTSISTTTTTNKNVITSASNSSKTQINAPVQPSRKRRLVDLVAPRQSTSESEFECHTERVEDAAAPDAEPDDDELDVGGKRLKMRSKLTHSEIRRKVEAKKVATEETTSSSGEEDPRRRRKIISPKRQLDSSAKILKMGCVLDKMKQHEGSQEKQQKFEKTEKPQKFEKTEKPQKSQKLENQDKQQFVSPSEPKRQSVKLTEQSAEKIPAPDNSKSADKLTTTMPETSALKVVDQLAAKIQKHTQMTHPAPAKVEEQPPPKLSAPLAEGTTSLVAELKAVEVVEQTKSVHSTTGLKQKPTLAEIIEKKLKKTPEKPQSPSVVKPAECSLDTSAKTTFSPPKKSPITKPLKKNLLTQIRQEESDEEPIPRKRTIGETVATTIVHTDIKSKSLKVPEQLLEVCPLKEAPTAASLVLKMPQRETPERQRKRRSSEEATKQMLMPKPADKDEGVSEKLKKNNEDAQVVAKVEKPNVVTAKMEIKEKKGVKVEIKKEVTPPPSEDAAQPVVMGRRSGRRGGAAVVYTELPQPKRTRAGAKAVANIAEIKEEQVVVVKKELTFAPTKETRKPVVAAASQNKAEIAHSEKKLTLSLSTKSQKETKNADVVTKPKTSPAQISVAKDKSLVELKPVKTEISEKLEKSNTSDKSDKSEKSSPVAPAANQKLTVATPSTPGPCRGRGTRNKREVDTTNIIEMIDSELPVRQSRRIAQQKIREEAERRKLEEIALRSMKQELKKKKKAEKELADPTVAEPSEHSSSSSEESAVEATKKKVKKKCPGKDGWSSGSEEQEEPEEEDEPPHYETDPGSPLFKSDHEFSPESDVEDESQVVPMKRARTARKEDAEEGGDRDEEACQKCGKSDHPEWILLCDNCDKGYHCSCLSPVLFYIPEGDWYCPPCQQEQLILALERQLKVFDELVERKRLEQLEEKRLAEEAERVEKERLELEKERLELEKERKQRKKQKHKKRHDGKEHSGSAGSGSGSGSGSSEEDEDDVENGGDNKRKSEQSGKSEADERKEGKSSKKSKTETHAEKGKRRRGDGRSRRRAAARGARRRRRNRDISGSGSGSDSNSGSDSRSDSECESSSSVTDSDDEPIYKLRKRRQINVSYRLNEFDDLINSALKKEMDEVAGAGNLGRGKDITTIIEADKEEKARQKQLEEAGTKEDLKQEKNNDEEGEAAESGADKKEKMDKQKDQETDDDDDDQPIRPRLKPKASMKKKSRKLTTLDISSEEDHASDEDFKTSSFDDEEDEDEDTSISVSTNSDSSLEVYRRRNKDGKKKQRKAARRAARERRKDRRFVVDETDDDDDEAQRPKVKKKRKDDTDYTESESGDDDEVSDLSENVDSADLCDDTTSEDSDGAWRPSKRKKQQKPNIKIARKSPKLKKPQMKKPKRVEYSDDDVSETEEEEDDDDDDIGGSGKGSGKQPRSQPLKTSTGAKGGSKSGAGKGKGKGKSTATKKKKKKSSDEEDSFSDSEDSTRRTRGRRYAYLEEFDDESSDGGIKPGVKRPDTPPEERQKFIQRQEEIKRMLAEKNAEGAKLAATPRLTPIKGAGEKDKRSPAKPGDSLSTVPLSVIRQAKVLDIDYLQRKGEPVNELDSVDGVESEFDDADLPDDFPEDMDEDAIARMVEEDGVFDSAAAARELPAPDEVIRSAAAVATAAAAAVATATAAAVVVKAKTITKEPERPLTNPSLAALSQMPGASPSGLQEPLRKRLPMPTMHPPLLRHQFPSALAAGMPAMHMMHRHPSPPTHLLQNALSTPLGQSLNRSFPPHQTGMSQRLSVMPPTAHVLPSHLTPSRQPLPATQPLLGAASAAAAAAAAAAAVAAAGNTETATDADAKPRGRRKKITPLRDPLQKQQAAAAATAAAATQASIVASAGDRAAPPAAVTTANIAATTSGGVIKSAISTPVTAAAVALSIAQQQPPHLYKPASRASETQPSVITRMPHLPSHSTAAAAATSSTGLRTVGPPPSRGIYTPGDVSRFYGPPQQSLLSSVRAQNATTASQRHRVPPQMAGLPPHPSMRPTYGPPPPLRGVISTAAPPNHVQPPTSAAGNARSHYAPGAPGEHHAAALSAVFGGPPPARHTAPHLNPYRPLIYGNPNFTHRGAPPPGANLRSSTAGPGHGPGPEYVAPGSRAYPPYGYYPPPPPLTAAHSGHPGTAPLPPPSTHSTAAPSSVIVAAPSASSAAAAAAAATVAAAAAAPTSSAPTTHPANHAAHTRGPPVKSSSPTTIVNNKSLIAESRKKLTTLEAYTAATTKSPLGLGGESSGSRSSPGMQPDATEDSSSALANSSAATTAASVGGEGQASEFSGLVSYFSSQHDDYNT